MIKKSIAFFSFFVVVLLAVQATPQEIDLRHQLVKDKGSVQGTVKSPDGQPISGAAVIFKNSPQKAITSADGRFMSGMYAGNYSAFVYKVGYKTLIKDNVEIIGNSKTILDITLVPDPINLGYGSITGRIIDQNGKPVSDAKVIIAESFVPKSDDIVTIEDFMIKGEKIETTSNRDGSFVFKKVPPGRFIAFAMKDGYKPFMYLSIYVETAETKNIEMTLEEQKYSALYGKVKSTDDEPIPGANVFLTGTKLGAATDGAGNFFIEEIPPGKYIVNVEMLGFKPYRKSITIEKNKRQKLVVAIEPDLSYTLEKKLEEQDNKIRLQDLRISYLMAESEADREQIKNQIRAFLETMFDLKEQEYAREIESKKKSIEALERLQKYRAANKSDIIERRLKELLTVY